MDWIADNNMRTVLQRHYPELGKALVGVDNAFQPWKESVARKSRVTQAVKAAMSMAQGAPRRNDGSTV